MMRRHVWKEVETSGDRWKAEESVLFFIYTLLTRDCTPAITTSLASRQARRISLSRSLSLSSLPLFSLSVLYLLLFCLCFVSKSQ